MITSSRLPIFLAVVLLVACSDPAYNGVVKPGSVSVTDDSSRVSGGMDVAEATPFTALSASLREGRRDNAVEIATRIVEPLSAEERNSLIDDYFDAGSPKKDNAVAVVLSEAIAEVEPETFKPAYIAGLAYWRGISVEVDPVRAVGYWSRPQFATNASVQQRLAELYADPDSAVYDPDLAAAARERAVAP